MNQKTELKYLPKKKDTAEIRDEKRVKTEVIMCPMSCHNHVTEGITYVLDWTEGARTIR